jgi:diguanylate cyclase (GGDEF)-like protein
MGSTIQHRGRMHPEPQHNDVARDPILDGRDSLRLVKLRLALALITVAILPIAAVSPLVRAVSEEARVAHHQRLVAEAGQVTASVEGEIIAIGAAAGKLLTDSRVVAAATAAVSPSVRAAASTRLGDLLKRDSGAVLGVTLLDASGIRAGYGAPLDQATLPAGAPAAGVYPVAGSGADDGTLLLIQPADPPVASHLSIVATISLAALLQWASPPSSIPSQTLALTDAAGTTIAAYHAPFDASALPGQFLDLATEAAHDSDGLSTLDVSGLPGWTVIVSAPIPLASLPVPAIGALGVLILLLGGFTIWMATQILRPASQLEASRSRLRELYESAREAALHDNLTGLGNHRAFQEAVARMVEGSRRYGTVFSLVLLDIDEFKRINDTRGHAVGDQLLAQVGDLIRVTIRHTDAGFRVGGDEFAVLLPHTDAGGAVGLARRLLNRGLEDRSSGVYREAISFSAGVTSCPEFGTTRLQLTAQADAALYRGKRAGRTIVTVYDPDKDHGHVDEGMRAELSSAISAVLESNWLTPVYQPIVELKTGKVLGYEGLVRVPRESAFPHAGALFDAAEIAGRVQDLDRAALDVVLRGATDVADELTLSLNVSPRTFEATDFNASTFLSILRRHGVRPERVILELTEREQVRDAERLGTAIQAVQAAGVRVAADDVGAGNAGLRLLSQFRFDVMKIDLSLVQAARQDQTMSVLTSLIQMANRGGAMTIAEGVETPAQLRTIRRLGVTAGQGYLLGRPGPDRNLTWVDLEALEARDDEVAPAPHLTIASLLGSSVEPADPQPLVGVLATMRSRSMALRKISKVSKE